MVKFCCLEDDATLDHMLVQPLCDSLIKRSWRQALCSLNRAFFGRLIKVYLPRTRLRSLYVYSAFLTFGRKMVSLLEKEMSGQAYPIF
jgi:hypothetical protein